MKLLNIHTHCPLIDGEATILTAGLHPWDVGADWQSRLSAAMSVVHIDAIGECGIDRLCPANYSLQLEAFAAQVEESERRRLPLIIHCVRATDDLLRLKRGTTQAWLWHGFRGKPMLMQQLLAHGFYISFGLRYNAASLAQCPAERLFLETDDANAPIQPLYASAAELRGTTTEALCRQLWDNAAMLFNIEKRL